MTARDDKDAIRWRVHLASPPATVHRFLSTAEGRERFWASSAAERDGSIEFVFDDGTSWSSRILADEPSRLFSLEYVAGSRATFELADDGRGGTDLTLTETGVPTEERRDNLCGWISVLLSLKAAVDFGVDLRNRDASRSWRHGYVDP